MEAGKTRGCAESKSADATLGISADAIERGLGNNSSGTEIRQAFDAMRGRWTIRHIRGRRDSTR